MNQRLLRHFFLSLTGALLLTVGWYAHEWYHRQYEQHEQRRVRQRGFRFISPLLDVELPEGISVRSEPIPFKYKIQQYVDQEIKAGQVQDLTVYYRDLFDGPWFGINEGVHYNPASMMKVPVMIAWLKRAELEPGALKRTFVFDGKQDLSARQGIKPAQAIVAGRRYTADELLHFMLNYSDNNATKLLYDALSEVELNTVLDSMDINNDPKDGNNSITAHGYSGFFRILYNAAFLNREMSEKALQLLSLQDFPQGIAAGVPPGIPVAAKFGEASSDRAGEGLQLHEFGIVYHPGGPYILGIMTRGHSLAQQTAIIRNVSALIYSEVEANAARTRNR